MIRLVLFYKIAMALYDIVISKWWKLTSHQSQDRQSACLRRSRKRKIGIQNHQELYGQLTVAWYGMARTQ